MAETTDKGVGLALTFGALAVVGAGAMLFGTSQQVMAWGFAGAVTAAACAVAVVQLYDA